MKLSLGEYLREKREERGIGLREMARRVKYTPSYLCDLERDLRRPSPECARRLAHTLKCDADYILLLSGQVPDDVAGILRDHPDELRRLRALSVA